MRPRISICNEGFSVRAFVRPFVGPSVRPSIRLSFRIPVRRMDGNLVFVMPKTDNFIPENNQGGPKLPLLNVLNVLNLLNMPKDASLACIRVLYLVL